MSSNKPHKGILKRMRVTKSGKVKHKSANSKHLKSHKSGKRLQRLRKDSFLLSSETKGLELLLFRRLRGADQPASTIKRSPSPTKSRELKAAKASKLAESAKLVKKA